MNVHITAEELERIEESFHNGVPSNVAALVAYCRELRALLVGLALLATGDSTDVRLLDSGVSEAKMIRAEARERKGE